jgi:AmiR/NasT family two-component response regulator
MVSDVVLAMQSAVAMEELAWSLSRATEHRSVVHQATGMVSVQLDSSMQDAFATLRSRAFTESVGVDEIAQQVVERMLRFDL